MAPTNEESHPKKEAEPTRLAIIARGLGTLVAGAAGGVGVLAAIGWLFPFYRESQLLWNVVGLVSLAMFGTVLYGAWMTLYGTWLLIRGAFTNN